MKTEVNSESTYEPYITKELLIAFGVVLGLMLGILGYAVHDMATRTGRFGRMKRRGRGFGDTEEVWDGTPYYKTTELVIA